MNYINDLISKGFIPNGGNVLVQELNSTDGNVGNFLRLGNCTALTITPTAGDTKKITSNMCDNYGAVLHSIVTGGTDTISISISDWQPKNVSIALNGPIVDTTLTSSTIANELATAKLGQWIILANKFLNESILPVITPSTPVHHVDELLATGDDTEVHFTGVLDNFPMNPASLTVSYTIATVNYTATTTLAGAITGTNLTGTINGQTGAYSLTFTVAPDDTTQIEATYDEAF